VLSVSALGNIELKDRLELQRPCFLYWIVCHDLSPPSRSAGWVREPDLNVCLNCRKTFVGSEHSYYCLNMQGNNREQRN
jgi:hypothetical protein